MARKFLTPAQLTKIIFNQSSDADLQPGELMWDQQHLGLMFGLSASSNLELGQQTVILSYNNSGFDIPAGRAVFGIGVENDRPSIIASTSSTSEQVKRTFGITSEIIPDGGYGWVATSGLLQGIDTSIYSPGDELWLSSNNPGTFVTSKTGFPNHDLLVGYCVVSSSVNGSIYIILNKGVDTEDIHDIYLNNTQSNQLLVYNSSSVVWENKHISSVPFDNIPYIDFATASAPATDIAKIVWDEGEGTLVYGARGGNVNLHIGVDEVALCYNGTGSPIEKGQVVYISGAQGQRPSIALSQANSELKSTKTLGIAAEYIGNGQEGFVTTFGILDGLNTSAFTPGQALWLSPTVPGGMTTTKTSAPNHLVFIGFVVSSHASSGRIFIKPQNGYEIDELHDVLITGKADNDIISYNASSSVWINQNLNSAILEIDGAGSNIDADLLDGQHGSYYLNWTNITNKPDPTITLLGDISGSATFTDLSSASVTVTIQPDSVALGTDTTGNYIATASAGNGIDIVGSGSENANIVISNTGVTSFNSTDNNILVSASTGEINLTLASNLLNVNTASATYAITSASSTYSTVALSADTAINSASANYATVATTSSYATIAETANAVVANSVELGRDTTGNYIVQITGTENQVTVTGNGNESASVILSLPQNIAISSSPTFASLTTTSKLYAAGSNANFASINIPHGTTPTSPVDGDIWSTASGFYIRVNGSTIGPLGTGGGGGGGGATVTVSATAPVGPETGALWYETDTYLFYVYDGAQWDVVGGPASTLAQAYISANAPVSASIGTLWIDENTLDIFTYYDSSWVQLAANDGIPVIVSSGSPTGAQNGTLWLDSDNDKFYVYRNNWIQVEMAGGGSGSNAYASLNSPEFTGIPTAPTAPIDTNTTQIATTAFVINQGYLNLSTASTIYQPLDGDLTAIAINTSNGLLKRTATNTWTTITDNSSNWDTAYTDRFKWNGENSGLNASTGRISLGATTVGDNLFTLTNPSAISFIKINADNTVTARSSTDFKTDLSINNVENTALSTWVGSSNITTLGTITTGTWNATEIGVTKGGTGLTAGPVADGQLLIGSATGSYTLRTLTEGTGISVSNSAGSVTITNTGVTSVNGSSGQITNVALTTNTLAQFAATTSSQLATLISDETGSGSVVFSNSPTITGTAIFNGNAPALELTGTPSSIATTNGLLDVGSLSFSDTNIIAGFAHDINNYAQVIIQNKNAGSLASADLIVNNNTGSASANYGDFGINSSGYTGTSPWNDPNGVYLYANGGTLTIGTQGTQNLRFVVNNSIQAIINQNSNVSASTFTSTVNTGTAPFSITSTTLVTNLNADQLDGQDGLYYTEEIIPFSKTGVIASSTTGTIRFRFPISAKIQGISAILGTAGTGNTTIDVVKNGTTNVNSSVVTLTSGIASEVTSFTSGADLMSIGDYITVNIVTAGTGAADLTVLVRYRRQ